MMLMSIGYGGSVGNAKRDTCFTGRLAGRMQRAAQRPWSRSGPDAKAAIVRHSCEVSRYVEWVPDSRIARQKFTGARDER
jgi:hypothetical protein